jgi:hypothetical protein
VRPFSPSLIVLYACESYTIHELDCHVARNPALLTPASSQKQAGSSTSQLQPQISISSIKRKAPDLETLLGKKRKTANINDADELQ